jgi:ADP-heptose:LPS heptosyltransferase
VNVFSPAPQRIAVLRALQLGDMLCAVPALRALRARCPQARITLIGLPWARDFAQRFSAYIDDFVAFPGFPGLPEHPWDVGAFPGFLRDMQDRRFDLALQLHGSGRATNAIAVLLGARATAGFALRGERAGPSAFFVEWHDDEHEVRRWLRLMGALGAPACGEELEFPAGSADVDECERVIGEHGLQRPFVCIHPGSQLPSRRWAPERFARVADSLAQEGYAIAITGTAGEAPLTGSVVDAMEQPAVDLAGRTSLGALAMLVRKARLVVCNDTGLSHIAAAMRTPSVVVSCGSDPGRWAPLDSARHHVLHHPIACRPCVHRTCPIGHPCAEAVHVDDVLVEARSLLESNPVAETRNTACAH